MKTAVKKSGLVLTKKCEFPFLSFISFPLPPLQVSIAQYCMSIGLHVCGIFATVTVLRGIHLGALIYLETKTLNIFHLRTFLQLH